MQGANGRFFPVHISGSWCDVKGSASRWEVGGSPGHVGSVGRSQMDSEETPSVLRGLSSPPDRGPGHLPTLSLCPALF